MVVMKVLRKGRDLLVYVLLKSAFLLASLLPPTLAYRLARPCGSLLYFTGRQRRHIALRNLDIGFRSALSRREKRRVAHQSFQHAMINLAGVTIRRRWVRHPERRFFDISQEENDLLVRSHEQGLVLLSAHVGDWEMGHHYLSLRGIPVAAVAREITNPYLDQEVVRLRSQCGGRVIRKRGALKEMRGVLRRGEVVGLVPDQNCPSREHFFKFLGVPASTYTEFARVIARTDARVLFVACIREGYRLRFRCTVRDLRENLPGSLKGDTDETIRERAHLLVRRYLDALEELVRAHPEQYLWTHRRWKSRPTGAPWLYHDLRRPLEHSRVTPPSERTTTSTHTAKPGA
jgi:KDO2-lipid IV(A) lauroyltransferase